MKHTDELLTWYMNRRREATVEDRVNEAVLAEREACKLIAQQQNTKYGDEIANAIRARGDK